MYFLLQEDGVSRFQIEDEEGISLSIPVTATSTGTVAVDAWDGWDSRAGTIFSQTNYGTTAKYLSASDTDYLIAKSSQASRDQEITTWFSRGSIYLRLTEAGKAFRFSMAAETNGWSLYVVDGFVDGGGFENSTASLFLDGGTLTGSFPGFNASATAGDEFTFGVSGLDVYIKFNGVESVRIRNIYHYEAGHIALGPHPNNAAYGFRDVSATLAPSAALYSNLTANVIDVRDLGCSTLAAVGSMSAGSPTLTLVSNPGFVVGDSIIVETGGEAGSGLPGSRGVGGQWPTLMYVDAATRDADVSQITGMTCGVLSNGNTYIWNGDSWEPYYTQFTYHTRILPRALLATVTGVAGTTLTLDTSSVLATTAANVYLNSAVPFANIFSSATSEAWMPTAGTISFPAGNFAFGVWNESAIYIEGLDDWTVTGAGQTDSVIFSPEGLTSLQCIISLSERVTVEDLGFLGNCRITGGYQSFYSPTTDQGAANPTNIKLDRQTESIIQNCRSVDHYQTGIAVSYGTDTWVLNCEIYHSTGFSSYTQWALDVTDCTGGGADTVEVSSPALIPGIEQFGTTNTIFRNITGTNALIAINGCADWLFENINVTLEENSMSTGSPTGTSPFVDINSNIGASGAGTFQNFRLVQEGYLTPGGVVITTFNFSGDAAGITIVGAYPDKPAPLLGGYVEMPDYTLGARTVRAVNNDAMDDITIDGIRVVGTTVSGDVIYNAHTNGIVQNCVADTIYAPTETANITNAAYEALP